MNNKILYSALLLVITFISCDQDLEITPEDRQTSDSYFTTPDDYQNALVGVYDLLGTTYLTQILGEIASDNSLCGGENATDVLDWQQIDDMTHNADNAQLRQIFIWMYGGIARASFIMENQDKIDFEGKAQIIAETRFLRTYYYFQLVKFFGSVPYYGDKQITLEETQSIDRMPLDELYGNLENDLILAIEDLPWQQEIKGKVTKGAALALLGKIYLYQNKFTEAANALDQVIQSGQYDLLEDVNSIFLLSNENNVESVFEIQYSGSEDGASFECFACVEGNVAVGFMGPRFTAGNYSPYKNGFSFNVPTPELYNIYSSNDPRRDATILDINAFVADRPDVTFTEGYEHTGYFNKKYIPYEESVLPDANINHSNNYRAIRFADVLLMAAEAYNRGNLGDGTAREYVNRVRERAGLQEINSSGNTLTQDIWKERRLELAGEGHRFFDQVRTGQTSSIPGFTAGKNELFPIPRIEIELTGNRWAQNPGY